MSEPPHHANTTPPPDELNEQLGLAPADAYDPLVEAFKKDVDRTLLRENLALTPAERARKFLDFARFANELREAGDRARARDRLWGLK